jgi:hypothetical protein
MEGYGPDDDYERFMGMAMAISNNITITTVNRTVISLYVATVILP